EDGIRVKLVTGVQTCALPISYHEQLAAEHCLALASEHGLPTERDAAGNVVVRYGESDTPLVLVAHLDHPGFVVDDVSDAGVAMRSEERRVGKEVMVRWVERES